MNKEKDLTIKDKEMLDQMNEIASNFPNVMSHYKSGAAPPNEERNRWGRKHPGKEGGTFQEKVTEEKKKREKCPGSRN